MSNIISFGSENQKQFDALAEINRQCGFSVASRLGIGGAAYVYEGTFPSSTQSYALKINKEDAGADLRAEMLRLISLNQQVLPENSPFPILHRSFVLANGFRAIITDQYKMNLSQWIETQTIGSPSHLRAVQRIGSQILDALPKLKLL